MLSGGARSQGPKALVQNLIAGKKKKRKNKKEEGEL